MLPSIQNNNALSSHCFQDYEKWVECTICYRLNIFPPISTISCGHMVCTDCLPKISQCPVCRSYDLKLTRNICLEQLIQQLPFYQCEHCDQFTGNYSDYSRHCAEQCPKILKQCNQCSKMFASKSELQHHQKTECENKTVTCQTCKELVKESEFKTLHYDICPKRLVACPVCAAMIELRHIQLHVDNCSQRARVCAKCGCDGLSNGITIDRCACGFSQLELIKCEQCDQPVHSRRIPVHKRWYCSGRTIECSKCQQKMQFKALKEHLSDGSCPKSITCLLCEQNIPGMDKLNDHLATECVKHYEPCDICLQLVMRGELEQHRMVTHDSLVICPECCESMPYYRFEKHTQKHHKTEEQDEKYESGEREQKQKQSETKENSAPQEEEASNSVCAFCTLPVQLKLYAEHLESQCAPFSNLFFRCLHCEEAVLKSTWNPNAAAHAYDGHNHCGLAQCTKCECVLLAGDLDIHCKSFCPESRAHCRSCQSDYQLKYANLHLGHDSLKCADCEFVARNEEHLKQHRNKAIHYHKLVQRVAQKPILDSRLNRIKHHKDWLLIHRSKTQVYDTIYKAVTEARGKAQNVAKPTTQIDE